MNFYILFRWTSPSEVLNFFTVSYSLHIHDVANNCRSFLRLQPFIWERSVYCICSATEGYSHSLLYERSHLFHCDVLWFPHFLLFPRCCCEGLWRWAYSRTACYILLSSVIPRAIYQRQSFQALTDLQVRQGDVQFQSLSLNRLRKSEKYLITHCGENNINHGLFLLLC
jgi:hypothetical protein